MLFLTEKMLLVKSLYSHPILIWPVLFRAEARLSVRKKYVVTGAGGELREQVDLIQLVLDLRG